jgi:hypothetical protein
MTIEIRQPELEALILQRLKAGQFQSVEDVLLDALRSSAPETPPGRGRKTLKDVVAAGRGLAVDLDISRDASAGRELEL